MKLLIAFALIVVAFADEIKVVRLPEPSAPAFEHQIDISPLIVPQFVLDSLKALPVKENAEVLRVNFVDAEAPVAYAESSFSDDEGLNVRFVNTPVEIPEPIVIVEAPLAEVIKPFFASELADENAELGVNIVDAPIETAKGLRESSHSDEGLKVRFVDGPIQAEEFETVRVAEPAVKSMVPTEAVKVVNALRPGKVFDNPYLR